MEVLSDTNWPPIKTKKQSGHPKQYGTLMGKMNTTVISRRLSVSETITV